eukprot:scaffold6918_cov380-Prasinococcus_capsulatus_cf.AAC.7
MAARFYRRQRRASARARCWDGTLAVTAFVDSLLPSHAQLAEIDRAALSCRCLRPTQRNATITQTVTAAARCRASPKSRGPPHPTAGPPTSCRTAVRVSLRARRRDQAMAVMPRSRRPPSERA